MKRRNILVKGLERGEENVESKVRKVLESLGVEVKEMLVKKIRGGKEDRGEMVLVRLESEEKKKEMMRKMGKLRGGRVWIEEDCT